jgi:hypothetical protein
MHASFWGIYGVIQNIPWAINRMATAFSGLYAALGPIGMLAAALTGLVVLFGLVKTTANDSATDMGKYLDDVDARRLIVLTDFLKVKMGPRDFENRESMLKSGTLKPDVNAAIKEERELRIKAEQSRDKEVREGKKRNDVTLAQTGREEGSETYNRILDAMLRLSAAGATPEEKTAENTKTIADGVGAISGMLAGAMGAMGNPELK